MTHVVAINKSIAVAIAVTFEYKIATFSGHALQNQSHLQRSRLNAG